MTDSPSTTKGPSLAQPEQAVVNLYRNTWSELFQKFLNQQPPVGLDEAALEIHIKEMQNGLEKLDSVALPHLANNNYYRQHRSTYVSSLNNLKLASMATAAQHHDQSQDHDSTPNNPDRPTPLPSKRDAEDRPSDYALVNKRTRLEGDDQGKASDSRNFTPGLASNAPLSGHGGAKLGYTVDLGSQLRKSSLPVDAASLSKTPSRNSMATSRSTPTSESAMSSVSSPFTPSLFGRSDNNSRIDSVSVERENTPQTEQWDSKTKFDDAYGNLTYATQTYKNALNSVKDASRAFEHAISHLNESRRRLMVETELLEAKLRLVGGGN